MGVYLVFGAPANNAPALIGCDMMKDVTGDPPLMDRQEVLTFKLDELRRRHRSLDDAIRALEEKDHLRDSLDLRRLKKEKLALRDQIVRVEDQLTPDIIA